MGLYTLDVGHGLCQVILFRGGRAILIDGGGAIGRRVGKEFLSRYVTVIVAYIATHNDADHIGNAMNLLDGYPTAETLPAARRCVAGGRQIPSHKVLITGTD